MSVNIGDKIVTMTHHPLRAHYSTSMQPFPIKQQYIDSKEASLFCAI
jgi:hypothetical protein